MIGPQMMRVSVNSVVSNEKQHTMGSVTMGLTILGSHMIWQRTSWPQRIGSVNNGVAEDLFTEDGATGNAHCQQ